MQNKINSLEAKVKQFKEKNKFHNYDLLNSIFMGISDPMYLIDKKLNILMVNDTLVKFQKISKDEMLGKKCYSVFKNMPAECPECYMRRVFKTGKKEVFENTITTKKGDTKFIETSVYPVFNHSNKVKSTIAIARDITQVKEAEITLKKSEAQYRTFLQNFDGISYQTHTKSFKPIFIHGKIKEITGYSLKNFQDHLVSWEQIVHPDDRNKLDDFSFDKKTNTTEKIYRIIRKDGTIRWVSDRSNYIESDDKNVITSGIIHDITATKLAQEAIFDNERKFRLIYETSAIGIVNSSVKDFKIQNVNQKFVEIFGYTKDELYNMTFADFTHPKELQDDKEKLKQLLEGKIDEFHKEKKYFHKNGSLIWGNVTVKLIRDENGKPYYMIATVEDITEQKKANDILKKSEQKLKELVATKDKLFSIIAHDLKSPFNTILGFTELLLNEAKPENKKTTEILEILNQSAHNTYRLLENLLEWSINQSGMRIYNPQKTNLLESINYTFSLLKKSASNKKIKLKTSVNKNLFVKADPDMLNTILRNLISNALKFTLPGGNILIQAIAEGTNKTLISVIDDGIGINKEDSKKLFRVDINHSTKGTNNESGTGLGLILCKEFVEKHNSKIWFRNNKDSKNIAGFKTGANFNFTLENWRD
ncbi:MAG: PAS domain S-box protein [Chlorobi bacterium]|nr:PAS domain S-box protein [Chlorobiota bacterium]